MTKKYEVSFMGIAIYRITVEADSVVEAQEKGLEKVQSNKLLPSEVNEVGCIGYSENSTEKGVHD